MKINLKNTKGFTLVELMIVIAIIGILLAAFSPYFIERTDNSYTLEECKLFKEKYQDLNYDLVKEDCLNGSEILYRSRELQDILETKKREEETKARFLSGEIIHL